MRSIETIVAEGCNPASAPARPPVVTCWVCHKRRRCVVLWYLPRDGQPQRHVGLPLGWSTAATLIQCDTCGPHLDGLDRKRRRSA